MKRKRFSFLFRTVAVLFIVFSVFRSGNYLAWTQEKILPAGFVYVDTINPTVKVELR